MDIVQVFSDELHSLVEMKPPVSKAKMGLITRAAMKGVKVYKHIVQCVEKFILKCGPEYKVPGLYVIDSIVRQSRHQFGIERDVYAARFSRNLQLTFSNLFSGCLPDDKPKIVRVLNLWQKNEVFNSQIIQPLLDMATPGSVLPIDPSSLSAASPVENSSSSKQGNSSNYHRHHLNNTDSSASRHPRQPDTGLKFNENMLDFDYDEDDDNGDETPTEAEPPLSSTLTKIEMEQRGHRTDMSNTNQSSQIHNTQHSEHKQVPIQDHVLERWNRLIRQQSISNDGTANNSNDRHIYDNDPPNKASMRPRSRSRSISPVAHRNSTITYNNNNKNNNNYGNKLTKEANQVKTQELLITSRRSDPEKEAERERKCLPKIRDKHLTVCSSTLWLGHVPKSVSEADISDAFGEFGTITSIDLIPPRGCAYVCMDRRQDAKRALSESRNLKLNGSHIKMAWAPGKGFKEYKKLKDFWESESGSSFIPYSKVDESIDFDVLEEGGLIDEDSMSMDMRLRRERKAKKKEAPAAQSAQSSQGGLPLPTLPIMTQPPPTTLPPFSIPPPTNLNIPPPPTSLSGQGLIPFPPPIPVSSSNGQLIVPPSTNNLNDTTNNPETDKAEHIKSPISIDQQLSMTERQINMVEQQLSMIQQAQNMAQPQQPIFIPSIQHHQTIFHPGGSIYEMPPHALLAHNGQQMLDAHHLAMFASQPQLLSQGPQILPVSQASLTDPSILDGSQLLHFRDRF